MHELINLTRPESKNVKCQWKVDKNTLDVEFFVDKQTAEYVNEDFCMNSPWKNFGLWNYDVVEFFVQNRDKGPEYRELQFSPLGQEFSIDIIRPREIALCPLTKYWSSEVHNEKDQWHVQMKMKLEEGDWWGNFYAIIGQGEKRQYYALNGGKNETRADFHRPQDFIKL